MRQPLLARPPGGSLTPFLAMRILVQFVAQGIGLVLIRQQSGTKDLPFKMWLYPVPVIISISIWIYIFLSTGWLALWGSLIAASGVIVYFIKQSVTRKSLTE